METSEISEWNVYSCRFSLLIKTVILYIESSELGMNTT